MPKPDFTGTWRFNHVKSALQIQAPDASVFIVEHREPAFRISRTHIAGEQRDTFSLDLTTDGKETVVERGNVRLHARAWWDGDTLVFDTRFVTGGEDASNVVRYALSADRTTIVADERYRSASLNYENVWVLDSTEPDRPEPPQVDEPSTTAVCVWCGRAVDEDAYMLRVGARLCPSCADDAARIAAEQRLGKT